MPVEGVDAYPLCWPAGWKRTAQTARKNGRYEVGFGKARDEALRSLARMGARDVVISSDVALRRDGLPYADAGNPSDPGVAVYWIRNKQTRVIACDHWSTVRDNMRAVGLTLEALRSIERAGASEILDRAFTGFTALPANAGNGRSWKRVLNLEGLAGPAFVMRAAIEASYKTLAAQRHPDAGGTHESMVELNAARAAALQELG